MTTNLSLVSRFLTPATVLVGLLGTCSAHGGVVLHDQTFATGTWEATVIGGTGVAGASVAREIGTGITGDALRTGIFGSGSFTFDVALLKNNVAYDPGTEGAISTINWELWYKVPNAGGFAGMRLIAQQGDSLYSANNTYREPELFSTFWQRAHGTIQGSDFQKLTGTSGPSLDFGADADPIFFGYALTRGSFGGGVTHRASFFTLDMQTVAVPEIPSSAWVGTGLLIGAILRRAAHPRPECAA